MMADADDDEQEESPMADADDDEQEESPRHAALGGQRSQERRRSVVAAGIGAGRGTVRGRDTEGTGGYAAPEALRELSLFTGIGGGLLGSLILGWRTVAAVEYEPYCQRVLCARGGYMADADQERRGNERGRHGETRESCCSHEPFPVHGDIRTFDGTAWRGRCDIVTGGFPCQPFSQAGKRLGADDPRNMWPHTVRVLVESGAPLGFFENVPGLLSSGYFGTVLGDLAEAGFDAEWCVLGADDVGAPHRRKRLWILAYLPDAVRRGRLAPGIGRGLAGVGGGRSHDAVPAQESGASMADAQGQPQRPGLRPDEPGGERRGRSGDGDRSADVGHAAEFGLQGVRPGRQQESRSHAGPGLSLRSGDGQAVGDSRGRLCAGRAPEPRRQAKGRASAGRSGEGGAVPDAAGLGWREGLAEPDGRWPEPCESGGPWWTDPADWCQLEQRSCEWRPVCDVAARVSPYPATTTGWESLPYVGRVAHGIPSRVDRLRGLGNAQVPQSMAAAFTALARQAGLTDVDDAGRREGVPVRGGG